MRSAWYKPGVVTPSLPSARHLTYEDWLRSPDDGCLYELIEGELFVTPPPNIAHQRVSRDLGFVLLAYLRRSGVGELLHAPVGVRLGDESVLEPDLLVVLREHAALVGPQLIEGPPDLVIEVLSPGTARRDLETKREVYRASRVPEYWIVDPVKACIEVLVLENDDYVRHGLFCRADTLRSRILRDFEAEVSEVFASS